MKTAPKKRLVTITEIREIKLGKKQSVQLGVVKGSQPPKYAVRFTNKKGIKTDIGLSSEAFGALAKLCAERVRVGTFKAVWTLVPDKAAP